MWFSSTRGKFFFLLNLAVAQLSVKDFVRFPSFCWRSDCVAALPAEFRHSLGPWCERHTARQARLTDTHRQPPTWFVDDCVTHALMQATTQAGRRIHEQLIMQTSMLVCNLTKPTRSRNTDRNKDRPSRTCSVLAATNSLVMVANLGLDGTNGHTITDLFTHDIGSARRTEQPTHVCLVQHV